QPACQKLWDCDGRELSREDEQKRKRKSQPEEVEKIARGEQSARDHPWVTQRRLDDAFRGTSDGAVVPVEDARPVRTRGNDKIDGHGGPRRPAHCDRRSRPLPAESHS